MCLFLSACLSSLPSKKPDGTLGLSKASAWLGRNYAGPITLRHQLQLHQRSEISCRKFWHQHQLHQCISINQLHQQLPQVLALAHLQVPLMLQQQLPPMHPTPLYVQPPPPSLPEGSCHTWGWYCPKPGTTRKCNMTWAQHLVAELVAAAGRRSSAP